MDKTIEQQARELLAKEYERDNNPVWAQAAREGRASLPELAALRAIARALTRPATSDEEVARRELLRLVAADPQGALVLCRIAAIEAKHVEQLVDEAVKRMARAALGVG